jgi:hypothetical protein
MVADPGKVLVSEFFDTKKIEIYANGYVKVSSLLGIINKGTIEKLIAVDGSSEVSKKSGLGRAAGAIFTGGLNLAVSNLRGNAFLNIITENQTHSIMVEAPTPSDLKALSVLVATGKSLAQRAASNNSASIPTDPATKDLATQLLELDGLHKSGVLTDEEFSAAKSRLLG